MNHFIERATEMYQLYSLMMAICELKHVEIIYIYIYIYSAFYLEKCLVVLSVWLKKITSFSITKHHCCQHTLHKTVANTRYIKLNNSHKYPQYVWSWFNGNSNILKFLLSPFRFTKCLGVRVPLRPPRKKALYINIYIYSINKVLF
jgi:hypothetical protein